MAYTEEELKKELETKEYEYSFYTDIDSDTFPNGLNKEIVRKISEKKGEPEWMTDWRLKAFESWSQCFAEGAGGFALAFTRVDLNPSWCGEGHHRLVVI